MRPVGVPELALWCDARMHGAESLPLTSVSTDSRQCRPGALFVAIAGEQVDGHDYLADALAAGAVAALVERVDEDCALPQLHVANSVQSLGKMAAALRSERRSTVLALTGSNGKTAVKSMIALILSDVASTYATPGNRNNEIGLPLALIDEPVGTKFAVYEMGAGQPGDIAYLAEMAAPTVALVNNIGPAHLERMGSLLGIAQTKGAIYSALPADGVAVVNADDAFGSWFAGRLDGRRCLRFGLEADADVRALELRTDAEGSRFILQTPDGHTEVRLSLPGRHSVANALAAATMATAVGVSIDVIAAALARVEPVAGRQVRYRLSGNVELIDDSYNANPASVAAAISTLAAGGGETLLVLGDMRELGPEAEALHREVGRRARDAGLSALWSTGPLAAQAAKAFGEGGRDFESQAELSKALLSERRPGLRCLVKGSRGSAMERVVAAVREADQREAGQHAANPFSGTQQETHHAA